MTGATIVTTACAPGALDGGPVRTRFFDGMFLTQADLETEQRYWRLKRRLTNRALGHGVVWGLRLAWQPHQRSFQLSPGYALDCCGNDLVVECPTQVAWADLWSRADPSLTAAPVLTTVPKPPPAPKPAISVERRTACVVLQYTECAQEPRTVQGDACGGVTGNCQLSRVRETARLLLVSPPAACETPPEKFYDALQTFYTSLPSAVSSQLKPPQSYAAPSAAPGNPAWLGIRVNNQPGSTTPVTSIQFPPPGQTQSAPDVEATESITATVPTAVVTFLVDIMPGWGFDAGIVVDDLSSSQTVTTVTTAASPEIAWTVQLTPPSPNAASGTVSQPFSYTMQNLQMSQSLSGGSDTATIAKATINGVFVVTLTDKATVDVACTKLTVTLGDFSSSGGDTGGTGGTGTGGTGGGGTTTGGGLFGGAGCLDGLVPWGWAANPDNGSEVARVLLVGAAYGLLQDYVANNPSAPSGVLATTMYNATWYALLGVDASANQGAQFTQLADLLRKLFQHWCCHFAYAGPRCCDEHHGVYLGTCELDRSGNVMSFDPWVDRRYVLTGPLLGHWAQQLGVAPIDVIVGRFAQALCCLGQAKGDAGASSPWLGGKPLAGASSLELDRFHVGTAATVSDFAAAHGTTVRYVGVADIAKRVVQAFTAPTGDSQEVLALQIGDGGTIGVLVPTVSTAATDATASTLSGEVAAHLKRAGDSHVLARSRPLVSRFVTRLLQIAPAGALVASDSPSAAKQLAKLLDGKHATVAELATGGPAAALARVHATGNPTLGHGADELVERAELAVEAVTAATVRVVGHAPEPAVFRDHAKHKALAKALGDALPKLTASVLAAAAVHAAGPA